jgi:hypothetical protein
MLEWIEHDGSRVDVKMGEKLALVDIKGDTYFWSGQFKINWDVVTAYCKFKVSDILPKYEKKRWRAKFGKLYYYVADIGFVLKHLDEMDATDNLRHSAGNYFRSEEQALASKIYQAFGRNQE